MGAHGKNPAAENPSQPATEAAAGRNRFNERGVVLNRAGAVVDVHFQHVETGSLPMTAKRRGLARVVALTHKAQEQVYAPRAVAPDAGEIAQQARPLESVHERFVGRLVRGAHADTDDVDATSC